MTPTGVKDSQPGGGTSIAVPRSSGHPIYLPLPLTPMRPLPFLLLLVVPAKSWSQSAPEPAMTTTGAFFALSVADLEASTGWYTQKLGLRIVTRLGKQNGIAVTVLEGGNLMVELIQQDGARSLSALGPGLSAGATVHGLFKAGVVVSDFDATLAMLRARGVEIVAGPFPARADQRANVLIRDNAGNLIQFFGK